MGLVEYESRNDAIWEMDSDGMKRTDMVDREVVNFDLWSLAFEHTDD